VTEQALFQQLMFANLQPSAANLGAALTALQLVEVCLEPDNNGNNTAARGGALSGGLAADEPDSAAVSVAVPVLVPDAVSVAAPSVAAPPPHRSGGWVVEVGAFRLLSCLVAAFETSRSLLRSTAAAAAVAAEAGGAMAATAQAYPSLSVAEQLCSQLARTLRQAAACAAAHACGPQSYSDRCSAAPPSSSTPLQPTHLQELVGGKSLLVRLCLWSLYARLEVPLPAPADLIALFAVAKDDDHPEWTVSATAAEVDVSAAVAAADRCGGGGAGLSMAGGGNPNGPSEVGAETQPLLRQLWTFFHAARVSDELADTLTARLSRRAVGVGAADDDAAEFTTTFVVGRAFWSRSSTALPCSTLVSWLRILVLRCDAMCLMGRDVTA
jgi:hypothetical protein